jgi:hypothetical protein
MGSTLTELELDFAYHQADHLAPNQVHLCTTIRDNCQNLQFLTLAFPPHKGPHAAPRASVCHEIFRGLGGAGAGMPHLKKAEIVGHHTYCNGSSREQIIEASEEVWAAQHDLVWEGNSEDGSVVEHECLHANVLLHGTPAKKESLLNCRAIRCVSGTLSTLPFDVDGRRSRRRRLEALSELDGSSTLILVRSYPDSSCNSVLDGISEDGGDDCFGIL